VLNASTAPQARPVPPQVRPVPQTLQAAPVAPQPQAERQPFSRAPRRVAEPVPDPLVRQPSPARIEQKREVAPAHEREAPKPPAVRREEKPAKD
jgi:hypothetical protein